MMKTSRAVSKVRTAGKSGEARRSPPAAAPSPAAKPRLVAVRGLRAEQKDLTRGLLLRSALGLFNEKGYANTTVDEIAAAAGTTRTPFYQHFRSKGELTQALILEVDRIFTSGDDPPLDKVIASGKRAAIHEWIDRKASQWSEARSYLMTAYQAAALEPEIDAAIRRWYETVISDIHTGLTAANRFPPDSRHIRGVLAFGQLEFYSRRWFHFGWDLDRKESIRILTDAWCFLLIE
jgi:AcrR family transcriptional regulator